jgi:hypothetical protein
MPRGRRGRRRCLKLGRDVATSRGLLPPGLEDVGSIDPPFSVAAAPYQDPKPSELVLWATPIEGRNAEARVPRAPHASQNSMRNNSTAGSTGATFTFPVFVPAREPSHPNLATLTAVCAAIRHDPDDLTQARRLAVEYPPLAATPEKYRFSERRLAAIGIRDGFVDRYGGGKLMFPGALRLLSFLLPKEFPYDPHWEMSRCHPMYWELCPTLDHVVPLARGGADDDANVVITSMLRNQQKGPFTLNELGWTLCEPGKIVEWDGQLGWFTQYARCHPEVLRETSLSKWYRAVAAGV